jgi:hypothetical protein
VVVQGFRKARLEGKRTAVVLQRFLAALQSRQRVAAAVQCFRIVRPDGQRTVAALQRFLVALQVMA